MELASGTLVSSKDRRDPSYAISHQLGNAGQTRVREGDIPDCSGKLHDPGKHDFRRLGILPDQLRMPPLFVTGKEWVAPSALFPGG